MAHGSNTSRTRHLLSTLGFLSLLLYPPAPTLGAPAPGFPLQSSQLSPVTGAVTISAPAVTSEAGLLGVQFKLDGYVLEALDTTSPFQIVWSAASTTDGTHTLTAEARYASGDIIESAPLTLTVANPRTFNPERYVDAANGNDGFDGLGPSTAWRTLGKANGAVQAGYTVYLNGTFLNQMINPAVSGTAASPITFKSLAGQTAVLNGGLGGTAARLDGRSYIVLDGIQIQNLAGAAVQSYGGSFLTIRNCVIQNITGGGYDNAVLFDGASDNLIENCTITNVGNEAANTGDIIWMGNGSHRNRILNNTIRDGGHGVFNVGGRGATCFDNVIARNVLSSRYTTVIHLLGLGQRTLVEHNKISDAAMNGVNYPRPGIQIVSSYNIIRYNEVFNNAAEGLLLSAYVFNTTPQDSIGNQIYHNTFYGNNQLGSGNFSGGIWIRIRDGRQVQNNLIANNIFFNNPGGPGWAGGPYTIAVDHDTTPWPAGSLNGNQFKNNIFLRQVGSAGEPMFIHIRQSGPSQSHTLAQLQSTYPNVVNNIEMNPLFVNESVKDFHLRSGSPAIDAGLVIAGISFNGSAPDLGVYETAGSGPDTQAPSVPQGLTASAVSSSQINLSWTASTDNVGVTGYKIFRGGTQIATTASPSFSNTGLSPSTSYSYSVSAYDAAGNNSAQSASASATTLAAVQAPFTGTPFAVPGSFQAEDFDNGGEGLAYHDNNDGGVPANAGGLYRTNESVDIVSDGGTGYKVNNFETGEWLEYTINVTASGTYRLEVQAASTFAAPASAFHLEIDGVNVTGSVAVPNTGGWNTFQDVGVGGISLSAGQHVLRIHSDQEYFDLTSIRVSTDADTQAPSVSLTAPAGGATVSGSAVTVSASASDNVGVAGVQFRLDGANLGAEDTTSPYSVSWDTTLVANGAHTLTAVARDAAGNTATSASISITVDNTAPVISAVASSAVSSSAATITWSTDEASDSQVEYGPTTAYGQTTTLNPSLVTSHSVGLSGLSASTLYHYRVMSRDAAGNLAVSADQTFTTLTPPDTTPPSSAITAPSAGTTVSGSAVIVSANASDNVGVVGVQFTLDGANLGVEDTSAPYSISWNTTLVSNGAHTLTAVARDAAGNSSTSTGVSVTVDNAAPVLSAVASSGIGSSSATITWTTNEASDSQVEYGPTTAYGQATALNATLVTSHSVGLSGLAPSTLYHYRVKSKDAAGNLAVSGDVTFTTLAAPVAQAPFRGTPFSIPGAFEAEDFDVGGESLAYHDNVLGNAGGATRTSEDVDVFAPIGNSSGLIVKNFETGEWLEYTINVAITGLYRIEARVATTFPNSAFHIEIDGVNVTGNVTVPPTGGWGTFKYVGKGGISLSAGSHVLRIRSDLQYFDLDVIRIETSGLVAAYSFDEASGLTVTDLSGNINQGTMTNGPVRVAGRTGSAVSFDGLNDYVLVPHSSSLSLSPALTLSAWVRKSSLVGYDTIFSKGTGGGAFNYYLDTYNGELLFGFVNGGYREFQTTGATLQPNTWYHLAATFDDAANTVRLYINGVQRAVFTTTISLLPNTQALYLGRSQASSGEYWHGLLDDLRIHSRALSQAEIQHDMTRGVRAPLSPVTGGAIPAN
jgi:chitodextrinase